MAPVVALYIVISNAFFLRAQARCGGRHAVHEGEARTVCGRRHRGWQRELLESWEEFDIDTVDCLSCRKKLKLD